MFLSHEDHTIPCNTSRGTTKIWMPRKAFLWTRCLHSIHSSFHFTPGACFGKEMSFPHEIHIHSHARSIIEHWLTFLSPGSFNLHIGDKLERLAGAWFTFALPSEAAKNSCLVLSGQVRVKRTVLDCHLGPLWGMQVYVRWSHSEETVNRKLHF